MEKKAHDSTACCPTVAPYFDRKICIIIASGESDGTFPCILGKETAELGRKAAPDS